MTKTTPTSTLRLSLESQDQQTSLEIINFNGSNGEINKNLLTIFNLPLHRIVQCKVHSADSSRIMWTGPVQFEESEQENIRFSLLIRARTGRFIEWRGLPKFFSVVDGGYEPLLPEQIGTLLDDLLQFQTLTHTIFFSDTENKGTHPISCKVRMEEISSTDAVVLEFSENTDTSGISVGSPTLITIELFESTYIIVGFIEDIDGRNAIFILTEHIYSEQRHVGRRFLSPPEAVSLGEIHEVSDVGMRLQLKSDSKYSIGNSIEINLNGFGLVSFLVIHDQINEKGQIEVGCIVQNDEGSSRNWIRFLLNKQYPLLRFRNPSDYYAYWALLDETGFTTKDFSEINKLTLPLVEREWRLIDSTQPHMGAAVVATDNGKLVGTVSVNRIGESTWNPGVLATTKNPKHMKHTRSLISWYTRFPLQQQNSEWCLIFFAKEKPFLDRFFRKFLLQNRTEENKGIFWEEWRLYTHILPKQHQPTDKTSKKVVTEGPSMLFKILELDSPTAPEVFNVDGIHFLKGRPFQHLCQYLSSAWSQKQPDQHQLELIRNHLGEHQIYTLRVRSEINLSEYSLSESGITLDDGWDVVWLCHRKLLSKYLSNSLRSLELMQRKYWNKNSA